MTKKTTAQEKRQQRHALARLKKLGLYSGDARKNPTKYGRSVIRKFSDVLEGKASVVKAPSTKAAREYKRQAVAPNEYEKKSKKRAPSVRVVKNKIVIPKERGETFRFDKKRGEVVGTKRLPTGGRQKKIIRKFGTDLRTYERADRSFVLPMARGGGVERFYFATYDDLYAFINTSSARLARTFTNWQDYVEIVSGGDDSDGEE